MIYVIPIVLGYLIGSVSFSYILGKSLKGIDVRQYGSGNAGATNTLRVLGVGPAIAVLLLDVLKGIVPVLLTMWWFPEHVTMHVVAGVSAIIGHNWPVFLKFKGGKGIATTIGVVASLCFLPALFAGIIAIISIVFTRYVSLGSLIFTFLLPIFLLFTDYETPIFILSIFIFIFALIRHRSNIVKLLQGRENKIGAKSAKKA
ncbi:glycerol-3-phosphate 1-O-acyltransferase PlsY [Longirhabdus pacifica]|uniref:glycerol-3-phosphate 1-O-acyltransferase PlsY n=1 Tax=Longirhabdus pacifica TaxID=2305227 RepID=UPI0013E8BC63|nr:glycerol-3-phosphate 1-O-acyltransferase PlsY [Longirhabdus pacifica]